MNWLHAGAEETTLTLHIQPGAKRTEIVGPHGDALKLRLAAPPVDGKANAALIDFLAKTLNVPRSAIRLVSGETARRKRVAIGVLTATEIAKKLNPAGTAAN